MLQTYAVRSVQVDAQLGMLHRLLRCQYDGIFLPFRRGDVQFLLSQFLTFVHRVLVYQLYADGRPVLGRLGPYREAVLLALLHADAEVALVRQTCTAVAMTWVTQLHIVRTTLERTVVLHVHTSKRLPTHQVLWKLERAVLHQFTIQSAVSGIVDVLEKNTIHGRLDRSPQLLGVHVHRQLSRSHQGHTHDGSQ